MSHSTPTVLLTRNLKECHTNRAMRGWPPRLWTMMLRNYTAKSVTRDCAGIIGKISHNIRVAKNRTLHLHGLNKLKLFGWVYKYGTSLTSCEIHESVLRRLHYVISYALFFSPARSSKKATIDRCVRESYWDVGGNWYFTGTTIFGRPDWLSIRHTINQIESSYSVPE